MSLLAPQKGKQEIAANLKVEDMIYGGSAGCVDEQTEVKTKNGWVKIKELLETDEICTYNADEDTFSYTVPEGTIETIEDDFYRLHGKGLDMVLTKVHTLIYWDKEEKVPSGSLNDLAELILENPEDYAFKDFKGNNFYVEGLQYYKSRDGLKYCVEVETGYFLARRSGCEFITGNSGKSRLLLNKAGYFAHTDPNFEGVMFRRTTKPLSAAGGLFSEAKKLFRPLGVEVREQSMEMHFHGEGGSKRNMKGGNLKFTHLEHEKDAEGNHQGLQYSFIGFDELTHFTLQQFLYLIGRMRSSAEGDSFCLATTNPDYNSWVYAWVSRYLQDGIFD